MEISESITGAARQFKDIYEKHRGNLNEKLNILKAFTDGSNSKNSTFANEFN
jgi:hypothetical protein